jgi:hypothetical protein
VSNPDALAVIDASVSLTRSHPSAPALDVLDLVMKGRQGQTLNFIEVGVRNCSLAAPSSDFGQLVARAFDTAMSPAEWAAFTAPTADPMLRDACLDVWRDEVFGRFCARYGVTVQGLP